MSEWRTPRPRSTFGPRKLISLRLTEVLEEQVRQLAADERRSLNTQLEILIERGLRSYGLEVAAA